MKKSSTIIIILIVIISIIAGVFYLNRNIKSEEHPDTVIPSGWKIYKDEAYGFTFLYPSVGVLTNTSLSATGVMRQINVHLPFKKEYDGITMKGFSVTVYKHSCGDMIDSASPMQKILNGKAYYLIDAQWSDLLGTKIRKYLIEKGEYCYSIGEGIAGLPKRNLPQNYSMPDDIVSYVNSEISDIDEVVSTFKFTK